MNKSKYFWFGFTLTLSIFFVVWCFKIADDFRGYDSIGSEFLAVILPLWLVNKNIEENERKMKKLKSQNKMLLEEKYKSI